MNDKKFIGNGVDGMLHATGRETTICVVEKGNRLLEEVNCGVESFCLGHAGALPTAEHVLRADRSEME